MPDHDKTIHDPLAKANAEKRHPASNVAGIKKATAAIWFSGLNTFGFFGLPSGPPQQL